MRGYAAIGLDNPKNTINVGSAMRAVGVYKASMLAISCNRKCGFVWQNGETKN